MSLKSHGEESTHFYGIGGEPQGSWTGPNCYLTTSNDNTNFVNQNYGFKFCDVVNIQELVVMIGAVFSPDM